MSASLEQLRSDLIVSAKRGYPILLSGAIYFFLLAFAPRFLQADTLHLVWILGLVVVFPLGLLLAKVVGAEIITKNHPLGNLGALVAGMQAFFLPVFILVYDKIPAFIPFTVGVLGAGHFLPYAWIYRSRAYAFVAFATAASSFVLGGTFFKTAFTTVPLAIAGTYLIGVFWILAENRKHERSNAHPL